MIAICIILLIIGGSLYWYKHRKQPKQRILEDFVFGRLGIRTIREDAFVDWVNKIPKKAHLNALYMQIVYTMFSDICTLRKYNKDDSLFLVVDNKYVIVDVTKQEWLSAAFEDNINELYMNDSEIVDKLDCLTKLLQTKNEDIKELPNNVQTDLKNALKNYKSPMTDNKMFE